MCEVIGIRQVSFKNNQGQNISGVTVYFTKEEYKVDGLAADKAFVSSQLMERAMWEPEIGDHFEPLYNKYGKLTDVRLE